MSYKIKELIIIVALVAFILFINNKTVYKDISTDAIISELQDVADLDNMKEFGNSQIKKDLGINANDYSGIEYYGHETVMESETLLIIRLSDESQGKTIIETIEKQRDSNMELFKSYAPDQYKLLEDSILEQKGKYIFYVVSDNASAIEKAFLKSITG